jgi:hypothetical protein
VLPGKVFLPVSLGQNEGDSGFPWLTWLIVWGVPHRLLLRLWLRGSFGKSAHSRQQPSVGVAGAVF